MKAHSINTTSLEDLKQKVSNLPSDFKPTLAIVFLSVNIDKKARTEYLGGKGVQVFGVTTNGEFIDEDPQTHPYKNIGALIGF